MIHESNATGGCPPTPLLALVSPSTTCEPWSCSTPQRHAFFNCKHMCAPSLASIPSPTVLWGKFLQDASCYSLNPFSSLNSIKLGITKVSNDLLIKNCFCGALRYLQQASSSLVNTWSFWLRFLSTLVSGNGSCPVCASPQKCWLSSSQVWATQTYKRQFNCTHLSEGVIWSLQLATRQQIASSWLCGETGNSRWTIH